MLVDVAQRLRAAPILVALTLAGWACGPVKGSGDGSGSASADGSSTFDATSVSVGSSSGASGSSASTTTASDSSTGAAVECPDNVALEPFCYRKFPIAWDGELGAGWRGPPSARVGNFGADGEEAFLLADREGGTPIGLAFWNGNGFDVQPWGVVPELSSAEARIPIRFFDGLHSDLLVGSRGFEPILAVAPWTPDGPGQPIAVATPEAARAGPEPRQQVALAKRLRLFRRQLRVGFDHLGRRRLDRLAGLVLDLDDVGCLPGRWARGGGRLLVSR